MNVIRDHARDDDQHPEEPARDVEEHVVVLCVSRTESGWGAVAPHPV